MGDKRNARDAPDTDDDDACPGRSKGAGAAGQNLKVEEAEMRSKKLSRHGEPRNLLREERKMMAIMRQIQEIEHKEKVVKAAPR